MKQRSPLAEREYWTCPECAKVLGRSNEYWQAKFDDGTLTGYRDGERNVRFIQAASARAYLESLCKTRPHAPSVDVSMVKCRAARRRPTGDAHV